MMLTRSQQHALSTCFALLAEDLGQREIRERIGHTMLDLFRADHFASYVWHAENGRFDDRVALHMDDTNLRRYEHWYQYRDPITFALQQRRHATLVAEVIARRDLVRSEFFNDFLARDGLQWGINLHAFDGDSALGDLRIWRGRQRQEFDAHDKRLLDLIEPAFTAALRRAQRHRRAATENDTSPLTRLSPRELDVARAVCRGLTDKEIARELGIGLPSVRTYLQRSCEKLGVRRRAALSGALQATSPGPRT